MWLKVEAADIVLLSKSDLVTPELLDGTENLIRSMLPNPRHQDIVLPCSGKPVIDNDTAYTADTCSLYRSPIIPMKNGNVASSLVLGLPPREAPRPKGGKVPRLLLVYPSTYLKADVICMLMETMFVLSPSSYSLSFPGRAIWRQMVSMSSSSQPQGLSTP